MKKSLSLMALVLALGLSLVTGDADAAKRLGSGKSTGMQRQSTVMDKNQQSAPAQTPAAPTAANTAAKAPAAAPAAAAPAKRSWMGPLAGLAAGLGLAALASHLGFGEELASMLMIGLALMAVLAVVGFVMRKRMASQRPALAGAGGVGRMDAPAPFESAADAPRPRDAFTPSTDRGSMIGAGIGANVNPNRGTIPADFDVAAFERNAQVQFIRLQAANDAGNLDDIRGFTTPEMFAEIQMNLRERGNAPQHTEVETLAAEVIEVLEEPARYVVSVRFSGTIREDRQAVEAFDEVWHLVKPRQGEGGWLLSGIQQLQQG